MEDRLTEIYFEFLQYAHRFSQCLTFRLRIVTRNFEFVIRLYPPILSSCQDLSIRTHCALFHQITAHSLQREHMNNRIVLFSVTFDLCSPLRYTEAAPSKNAISLSSWLNAQGHPLPPECSPSQATVHLHTLSRTHGISVQLKPVASDSQLVIATISLEDDLKDVPKCVLEASEASLQVLSHYFRQVDCCGDVLTCTNVSRCGFTCCNDSCGPQVAKKCQDFHLDNVFSDCSAAEANDAVRETNVSMHINSRIGRNDQLSRLPHDIQLRIIEKLSVSDVHNLHATSRLFRAATQYFVPGLKVQLYPHQCAALDRMRRMEGVRRKRQLMPMLRPIEWLVQYPFAVCPLKLFADCSDGALYIHTHIPTVPVSRGGILADEPGLGKTVTAIALILKSLDQRSKPPERKVEHSYEFTRPVVKKRKRSSMAPPPSGETVNMKYYEEVTTDTLCNRKRSTPVRRTRILSSRNVKSTHPGLRYLQENTEDLENVGMETRRSAQIRLQAPTVIRHQILLTGCTLLLCPKPLVMHWLSQIQDRASNRLRIGVIRKCSELPSKEALALDYDVVIVSFTVIQWMSERMKRETPSLYQVRFLRVLYDEGHEMGGRSEVDSVFRNCNLLNAERRWILTGTPAPSNPYSDVRFLRPLLVFIREPTYGMDSETWLKLIQKPYSMFRPESLLRLKKLLREIMIRSEKRTISSIPKCTVSNVFLKFPKESAQCYNELVMIATRNIVTSDWFSETHKESLLNERNRGPCHELVSNLRQACVFGGGFSRMDVHRPDLVQTLEKLYAMRNRGHGALRYIGTDDSEPFQANMQRYGVLLDSKMYHGRLATVAKGFLEGAKCNRCSVRTKVPFVTPCAHLVCNACILEDRTGCPVENCRTEYSLDSKLVPDELIEMQPSVVLGFWKTLYSSKSAKMDYLLNRLAETPYNHDIIDGKPVTRQRKVIVYSQFDEHLMRVALELQRHTELRDCYAELYPNSRDISRARSVDKFIDLELTRFKNNDKTFVLLLGKKYGSVGLDLSFVEHIYLLEPFWDSALEKQVISRAHRLGAKAPIHVERLVMIGSVEEDAMLHYESLRQNNVDPSSLKEMSKQRDSRRGPDVLLRLTPIQTEKPVDPPTSPVTPAPKRTFPLLEGYTASKELALKHGVKRSLVPESAKKRRVRRKLWS